MLGRISVSVSPEPVRQISVTRVTERFNSIFVRSGSQPAAIRRSIILGCASNHGGCAELRDWFCWHLLRRRILKIHPIHSQLEVIVAALVVQCRYHCCVGLEEGIWEWLSVGALGCVRVDNQGLLACIASFRHMLQALASGTRLFCIFICLHFVDLTLLVLWLL